MASKRVVEITEEWPIKGMVADWEAGKRWHFVRYSDGEWHMIVPGGISAGGNCDGNTYFPEIGVRLRQTVMEPHDEPYYYGRHDGRYAPKIREWIQQHSKVKRWFGSNAWYMPDHNGELGFFYHFLQTHKVVLVGPVYLATFAEKAKLNRNSWKHIVTPGRDSFLELDRLTAEVRHVADTWSPCLIMFIMSMATNIAMWELYPAIGHRCSMIDIGSLFDPYCGKKSRSLYRSPNWKGSL
jgi:hypothetical protein